ncbi:MAG: glycoside hydrolase family 3 C-terminal domain-containing protein, partial [Anaerolineae bacterium]|nr:glycoside hydrolase family 3 C-terminal domain-containing protein [Anaerolineae bacterium]
TGKHFPGHGDTNVDSHFGVPTVSRSYAELEATDLVPFAEAVRGGIGAIMTAHIRVPALDPENVATVSPQIVQRLLRQRLAFDGLILTDAMDMHAVNRLGMRESVHAALRAGIDLVLLGHLPEQLQMTAEMMPEENAASRARIERARTGLPRELPPLDVIGCAEHRAVAQAIADAAITAVRDDGQLPLRPSEDEQIAVITVHQVNLTPADTSAGEQVALAEAIRARHRRTTAREIAYQASSSEVTEALDAVADADVVVVGTICADQDMGQAALVRELYRRGQHPVVVALRTPYDLCAFPEIGTYLCAYSARPAATEAVARVLFGEIEARGVLPCTLPGLVQA